MLEYTRFRLVNDPAWSCVQIGHDLGIESNVLHRRLRPRVAPPLCAALTCLCTDTVPVLVRSNLTSDWSKLAC